MILSWSFSARASPKPWNFSQEKREPHRRRTDLAPASLSDFRLPPPNSDNRTARNYLTAARRIDEDVTGFFFARGDIYEDAAHHNAVFVGRDEDGIPRYAHSKGTAGKLPA